MGAFVNLAGKTFGRWLVLEQATDKIYGKPAWVCKCTCGVVSNVGGSVLRMGESTSCGCYKQEVSASHMKLVATKHGKWGTPNYYRWMSMKLRCYCPTHPAYKNYGGRGIRVCQRWLDSYAMFETDIGPRPTPKHSLDRINNEGDYEPNNVRWATHKEQANNRRKPTRRTA